MEIQPIQVPNIPPVLPPPVTRGMAPPATRGIKPPEFPDPSMVVPTIEYPLPPPPEPAEPPTPQPGPPQDLDTDELLDDVNEILEEEREGLSTDDTQLVEPEIPMAPFDASTFIEVPIPGREEPVVVPVPSCASSSNPISSLVTLRATSDNHTQS